MHWAHLAYRPWFEYIVGIRTLSELSFTAEISGLESTYYLVTILPLAQSLLIQSSLPGATRQKRHFRNRTYLQVSIAASFS